MKGEILKVEIKCPKCEYCSDRVDREPIAFWYATCFLFMSRKGRPLHFTHLTVKLTLLLSLPCFFLMMTIALTASALYALFVWSMLRLSKYPQEICHD